MTEHADSRNSGIRAAAEQGFTVLTALSLLGSLAAMLTMSPDGTTPMWLTYLRLASALAGLLLWNRKDTGFWILAAYLGLVLLRLLIPSPEKLFDTRVSQTLFNGAWAFLCCYSLGHILDRKQTERFLKVFLTAWVFGMACFSAMAVYAAWTDRKIWNIGQGAFWGLDIVSGSKSARLMLLFEPNTSGTLAGLAVVAAFLCICGSRNGGFRVFHLLMLIPSGMALSLTDSRAAQISTAIGIGTAAGILVLGTGMRKTRSSRKWPVRAAAAACALATVVVCMLLAAGTTKAFNRFKTERGNLVPGAAAESAGEETPAEAPGLPSYTVSIRSEGTRRAEGDTVTLTAVADGAEGAVFYQWQTVGEDGKTWVDLPGEQNDRITVAVQGERRYRCVVTADNGVIVSKSKKVSEPAGTSVKLRGYNREDLLNGRTDIWKQAIRYLKEHPKTILIGKSIANPMKDTGIVRNKGIPAEHCHNMFLQTVMESGIPGLILMLLFMLCAAGRAVRTVSAKEMPLLLRLLPAAVCSIWAGELVECIVQMANYRLPNFALLMLYAGMVCALGKKNQTTEEGKP